MTMAQTHHSDIPDDATIKDINAFKKRINWGEIPAFFQMVASSVAEAEGFINYGFDNAFKRIVDRKNWNYQLLGVDESVDLNKVNLIEQIEPLTKPRICLYHVFNTNGYELLAFPYVGSTVIDEYRRDDPKMEFTMWDPSQMKVLVRISQLHKFIAFNINKGDDADMALIVHANQVVDKMIEMLKEQVNVHQIKGMTIRQAYNLQSSQPHADPNQVLITQLDEDIDDQT